MKKYSLINNVTGWLVFIFASLVYLMTMEASVSFWDCGEFISAAYKLQVVHPPGAPMFLLIARIFTLFAFGDPEKVALMVNALAALSSSFAILFLFWTITAISKKIMVKKAQNPEMSNIIAVMGAGIVGSMACCFADSFWFSAVEGEVYALSSFFTSLVVWAIFKWENVSDDSRANRWLVFIAFIMGVSVGVHLLNLLAIPALAFVYYFKRFKPSRLGIISAGVISIVILGFIQFVVILKLPEAITTAELFFTNTLGMPFNTGSWFIVFISLLFILVGVWVTHKYEEDIDYALSSSVISGLNFRTRNLNTIIVCLGMILIGYSSYFMVVIRSTANPAIDMNNPEDPFNLLSYLQREQYGSAPVFYGQYYPAQQVEKEEVSSKYYQDINKDGEDEYFFKSKRYQAIYEEEFCGVFPRMWSPQKNHIRTYRNIAKPTYEVRDRASQRRVASFKSLKQANEYVKKSDNPYLRVVDKFTFANNLKFFSVYQVGWMYVRYFLWNFGGRQNDMQGHMGTVNGNWQSGIDFIDEARGIIPNKYLPQDLRENKAYNPFYLLPFILGVIGLFYHFNTRKEDAFVVFLLWFFTGIAILIFLNQYPYQPRERDYAFAGSVYAFCIWIGIGTLGVYELFNRYLRSKQLTSVVSVVLCFMAVPFLMGFHGWDDHNRSNRYTARDFAINYLESCEPNAILFTQGDNDTYPLWYAQEVEGIRTDIRIVNLSLLAVDWYIDYLKRAINNTGPVPFTLSKDKYRGNKRDVVIYQSKKLKPELQKKGYDLKKTIQYIASENPRRKMQTRTGDSYATFPSKKVVINVDREQLIRNEVLSGDEWEKYDSSMTWSVGKRMLYKNDLMVLDLVAHNDWKRPIYFAVSVSPDAYVGLEKFFRLEGLAYRLVPVKTDNSSGYYGYVDTDKMYDNLMNKFRFGGIEKESMYLDEGILRMAMNLRIQYARLAEALIAKGEKEKAKKVLDKCLESLPKSNVPYNIVMMQYVDMYYKLGDKENARKISESLIKEFKEKVGFYHLVSMDYRDNLNEYKREFRQSFTVANNILSLAKRYEDKDYSKELDERLKSTTEQAQSVGQLMFSPR